MIESSKTNGDFDSGQEEENSQKDDTNIEPTKIEPGQIFPTEIKCQSKNTDSFLKAGEQYLCN